MFCEKCGSQIEGNATFCPKCGIKINNDTTPPAGQSKTSILKNKKPLIITLAIILAVAITATIIGVSVSSCKKNKSLEEMLTAHTWIKKSDSFIHTLDFGKNGSCTKTSFNLNTELTQYEDGTWSITSNELKWKPSSKTHTYHFWENLSDTDIERNVIGSKSYSWYVSDKYFVYCRDSDSNATVYEAQ